MTTRILFVPESPLDFGAALQLQVLVNHLDREQFELELAIPHPADSGESSFDFGSIETHHCDRRKNSAQRIAWLRNLAVERKPNLVHAWGNGARSLVATATKMLPQTRRLFTLHSQLGQTGPFDYWSSKVLNRRADSYAAPHRIILDQVAEAGVRDGLHVIPNSVPGENPNQKSPSSRKQLLELIGQQDKPVWLAGTVSSFQPKCRLKDLVWAIDLLCCVRDDIHLLIFGTGDDARLRQFTAKTVAGNNVHIVPPELFSDQQLTGLDIYWNAQLETPNPTGMLQAMAQGIPVVSVLGEETEEVVLPLQTALATNFGSRDEFARWTKFLIEQSDSSQQIALQARQFIEKKFPISTTVSAYQDLYSRLALVGTA